MLRSDADAPKPPAYPFIHHQCQRAQTQKSQNRQSLGASRNRASRVSYHRNLPIPITNPAVTASPRPVRFGEPVFRPVKKNPQEENVIHVTIFSCGQKTDQNLAVGAIMTTSGQWMP
jgi:hypothetical protein